MISFVIVIHSHRKLAHKSGMGTHHDIVYWYQSCMMYSSCPW